MIFGEENTKKVNRSIDNNIRCPKIIDGANEHAEEEDQSIRPRFQSFNEIYNSIDDVHVVCLLTCVEDIKFKEF